MDIIEIRTYLAKKKLDFDPSYFEYINENKRLAVEAGDEALANELWCLNKVASVQAKFISMYAHLKSKEKYGTAWNLLENIDITLSALRPHFDCGNDDYSLFFIGNIIHEYEKLFPYFIFISREGLIKKEACSICEDIISLRNPCGHKVGNLYMGEMCYRIVKDYEFLGAALVSNPFNKYSVLTPENKEYNYFMLDHLMEQVNSPYDRFYVEIFKIKDSLFETAERNKPCPCESGGKYKKCCLGTERELINHHRITFLDAVDVKPSPIFRGNTWK